MKQPSRTCSWIGVFAIAIALFAGIPTFAQPATAQTPEAESTEEFAGTLSDRACPNIGPAGEREGDTYFCGIMTVPENYDKPTGKQLQISFAVLKSYSRAPLPDPMIYLDGGPGGSSLQSIAGQAQIWEGARKYRDVIIFDQRGTKYSNRLNCDPYRFGFNYLLENDEEFQELYAEIQDLTDAESLPSTVLQIIYEACADGLTEAGYDLTQFNSANSVKDIFALSNALGYDEINLVGISYGTRLALTAMRDHPQQIRSVVIDSVYPLDVNGIEWFPRQADEPINRIVQTCENDRECNRAFPNFRENLQTISQGLAESNPDALFGLYALFNATNTFPALAEYLPLIIEEIVAGNGTPTLDAVQAGDLPAEDATENQPGEGDDMLLQAQDLQETAESLFLMAAMQEQAQRPGALLMKKIGEAMAPLSREENGTAAIALLSLLIYFPEPSADVLGGFVTEFLPEEAQEELLADIEELDASELQYVYDLINDLSDEISEDSGGYTQGMYFAVECQEEAPFNDVAVAEASIEQTNFPELARLSLASSMQIATVCDIWPNAEPDPIETEPVVSDIPTLILVGDWDTQTPASWGKPLLEHLSNATLVEAPSAGHGVIFHSTCSYDIFLAFLASPEATLNLNCLRGLEPNFVTASEARAQIAEIYGEDGGTETQEGEEGTVDPDTGEEQEPEEGGGEEPGGGGGGGGGEDRPVSGRRL
jgi:pimeloyl-ACP methyl ester carboxylesterase